MYTLLSLFLISLMGAMSPGPDFAIVTRCGLSGSRKAALFASLGVSAAILIHVTYCSLGLAILIAESPLIFHIIQIGGSLYLGYLGVKLLLPSKDGAKDKIPSPKHAFISGFVTNLLNPKATLFILSVYTQFVEPGTPILRLALYGIVIAVTALAWFAALSILITHRYFLPHFAKFQKVLMKCMGIILLGLAISVLLASLFGKF